MAWERRTYAGFWVLMLAPVVAHALARPLVVELAADSRAPQLTLAALLVALVGAVGSSLLAPRTAWGAVLATGLLATVVVGRSVDGLLTVGVPLLAVASATMLALPRMLARLPARIDGLAREHRKTTVALALLAALALLQTSLLATFVGDPNWSTGAFPLTPDLAYHACSSAYMRGAELASAGVDNLYAAELWPSLAETPASAAAASAYAPFELDAYAYPPTFLVIVRPLLGLADFSAQRALWFGLNALALAYGLWMVAAWVGEQDAVAGTRAALLALVFWVSGPVIVTLQTGNVHFAVLAAAAVAMVCFERKRPVLGGALLAWAILAKISPGLLGIVLLVRRQFREALWTAGFGVAWVAATWLAFGSEPFVAFVEYELPRLSSGEALAFFTAGTRDIAMNLAPFGLPFKLGVLGFASDDPWATGRIIAQVFNVMVLGLTIVAGFREGPNWRRASAWMGVLTLGGMSSPFAPTYVGVGVLWALCLWAANLRGTRGIVAFCVGYLAVSGAPPLPDQTAIIVSLIQQSIVLGAAVYVIVTRPEDRR
jgi:hypothetical protein